MLSGRADRHKTIWGDEEPGQERVDKTEGADPYENLSGSKDSTEGIGGEGKEVQKLLEVTKVK